MAQFTRGNTLLDTQPMHLRPGFSAMPCNLAHLQQTAAAAVAATGRLTVVPHRPSSLKTTGRPSKQRRSSLHAERMDEFRQSDGIYFDQCHEIGPR